MTDSDLVLAHRLADLAAEIGLGSFGRPVHARYKADGTEVTDVDLAIEDAIVGLLRAERPDDAVLGEEGGEVLGGHRRWIIDPLDMTARFLAGEPEWGTHVALEIDGVLELGIMTRPVTGQRWWAARGEGAFLSTGDDPLTRQHRLGVSDTRALEHARVSAIAAPGEPSVQALAAAASWFDPLTELAVIGALAEGRVDVVIDTGKPWDLAPVAIIVPEAGGSFFDPQGGTRLDMGWGCFTNGHLDDELRRLWSIEP